MAASALLLSMPDYLAGAGPMAGGEPLKNAPAENCAHIAFSLRTGADDRGFYRNILTGYVKEEFERLQTLHPGLYTHQIELIPGKGHSIDYRPTTPWLKQYTATLIRNTSIGKISRWTGCTVKDSTTSSSKNVQMTTSMPVPATK